MRDASAALPVWRSLLYVPANNQRFIDKAHTRGADAIILDLEDSVPAAGREAARRDLSAAVASVGRSGADVLVRINRPDDEAAADIAAAVAAGVYGLMVSKAGSAAHMQRVEDAVGAAEGKGGSTRLLPLIETAAAYFNALEIANGSSRNVAMLLGGEDFATDAGMEPAEETLLMPKQQILLATRAAGLMPLGLIGTVADFGDAEAVAAVAERSRRFGFEGASCVHPSLVPVLNRAFTPSPDQLERARRIVDAYVEAEAAGTGAITVDGKMVDVPVARRAERLLARWRVLAARDGRETR